jgi:hypothetical protein
MATKFSLSINNDGWVNGLEEQTLMVLVVNAIHNKNLTKEIHIMKYEEKQPRRD